MNLIFARWIRRPIRTSLWTALLIVACMVLSLGFSVYADGKQAIADIKSQFTTVAFPLLNSTPIKEEEFAGGAFYSYEDSLNDYSELLSESPGVLLVDERKVQSVYSSDILPILSAEYGRAYRHVFDKPYAWIMFEGTVMDQKLSEINLGGAYNRLQATIRVDNVIFSHEKQEVPDTIEFNFTDFEPLTPMIENERYIFFGNLSLPEWSQSDEFNEAWGLPPTEKQAKLNTIMPTRQHTYYDEDGNRVVEYIESATPAYAKLDGSVEEFLSAPDNTLWTKVLEDFNITNHSLLLMGTNSFESLYSINQGNSYISSGRTFTQKEYASGEKVCIIGEALAQANEIEIGDSISLQPYYYNTVDREYYHDMDLTSAATNPSVELFEGVLGFCADTSEYKVIGLYKQNNMWSRDSFCFSPNTVFVPLNSMEGESYERNSGVYISVALEDDSSEEFMNSLVGTELEEQFLISDQGYSEAVENITKMMNTNTGILLVSVLVFIAIVFFYVALQIGSDNHIYKTMRQLGEDRNQFNSIVFWSNMLPLAVAVPVAGVCTLVLKDIVFMKVFGIENTVENSYSIIIVLIAIVLIIAVSILLYLPVISKRSLLQASGAKIIKSKRSE